MRYLVLFAFMFFTTLISAQDEYSDQALTLYAPNCFTPDLDGINDVWKVFSDSDWDNVSISIFNEWGDLVWRSNSINDCWQGNIDNGEYYSPDGQYFYVIKAELDGEVKLKKGKITMIR